MRTSRALALLLAVSLGSLVFAAPDPRASLLLSAEDLRIEQRADGGYHLYIRKKPGIGSVLLAESTKDPDLKEANYSYRALEWNPVNGDEKRMLNGAFIPAASKVYSLIDSSAEADEEFGEAFHIFIPWVVAWGYSWTRNGQVFIHDGTFINVRTFNLPYGDYAGAFFDNPYLIRLVQKPQAPPPLPPPPPAVVIPPPPEPVVEAPPEAPPPEPEPPPPEKPAEKPVEKPDLSRYIPKTVDDFTSIAKASEGEAALAKGPEDIVPLIGAILDKAKGKTLDLVLCLDTTDSMGDDIAAVKAKLPDLIRSRIAGYETLRLGLVLYKDYFEEYVVKDYVFTPDVGKFLGQVQAVKVGGGRDIPEAVYEALYEALTAYAWTAETRLVILIGDAPPHPIPRGKIDKSMVEAAAAKFGVEVDTIILPN